MNKDKAKITFDEIVESSPFDFHGGIHPQEFKSLSNESPIAELPLINHGRDQSRLFLTLAIQQNNGRHGEILVTAGEDVVAGQLVVEKEAGIGSRIHAPHSGRIVSIGNSYCGHPSGQATKAIKLQVDHDNSIKRRFAPLNWQELSNTALLDRVTESGIVGMGGAGFPTQIKLAATNIDTLIVNAMECEPYITCDDRMLRELPLKVIEGACIAAKLVAASSIIFAIEDNKPEAIKSLRNAILSWQEQQTNEPNQTQNQNQNQNTPNIKVVVAPTKYPSGGEKQTIELVTGKQLPTGQLPASLGLIVQNVATLHALFEAVVEGAPLVRRLVTITGDLVNKPGNYWLPIGSTLETIQSQFAIQAEQCGPIILGGPMMGNAISDLCVPINKGTNCIIFNKKHSDPRPWLTQATEHQPCIRCGECETACPASLLPQQLLWFSQSDQWDNLESQGLMDCIECGACAYVCPSEIPLVSYYRYGKSVIRENTKKQQLADHAKQRFDFRETRLAKAKAERALKHQKAAAARKKAALDKKADPSGKQNAINDALARVQQKKQQQESSGKNAESQD